MPTANKDDHYNWIVSPDSYLAMALLGCKHYFGIFGNLGFRSNHADHEFIYPIVFSFKQSMELYIKGLGVIDIHEGYEGIHDLKVLIETNVEKSKGTKSEIIWKKLAEDI